MKISIKFKFAIVFLLIFSLSALIFTTFIKESIARNNEDIIKRDMTDLLLNSRAYLRHFLIINEIQPQLSEFKSFSGEIATELSSKVKAEISLYTPSGKLLANSFIENQEALLSKNAENLKLAQKNQAIASVIPVGENTYVEFSFPVYIDNVNLGLISLTRDYTDLYAASTSLISKLIYFVAALFNLLFLAAFYLASRITSPLIKLKNALSEIAKGNYDNKLTVASKDETGELADSFTLMQSKIKEQINTIEAEKEKLVLAGKHRQEFFNNVTHELKTPLTTISGYAQILEEENYSGDALYTRAVQRISSESDRLHDLVVELLEISKGSFKDEYKYEKIELLSLITLVSRDMKINAQKNKQEIKITFKNPLYIRGDIAKMQEVFLNLLDNAIKYSNSNTEIIVSAFKTTENIFIEITNEGPCIPSEKADKVFEPFYRLETAKGEKTGSGLGLFICKNIVQKHGGAITLESKKQSTKIILKFPPLATS